MPVPRTVGEIAAASDEQLSEAASKLDSIIQRHPLRSAKDSARSTRAVILNELVRRNKLA